MISKLPAREARRFFWDPFALLEETPAREARRKKFGDLLPLGRRPEKIQKAHQKNVVTRTFMALEARQNCRPLFLCGGCVL